MTACDVVCVYEHLRKNKLSPSSNLRWRKSYNIALICRLYSIIQNCVTCLLFLTCFLFINSLFVFYFLFLLLLFLNGTTAQCVPSPF